MKHLLDKINEEKLYGFKLNIKIKMLLRRTF